ncbi:hypothetical protein SAMN05892877_110114 [Rhizobium subbaraonis]|uniref:Uncharacterized protein n=1 Tax=Rhizobium subbaraonis TaxID=908946 RepID=A0A285UPW0_9HYPH|nr:hypothetical protein [Rhizobium subbaraonis]SOC42686.1 hypothetical protein SAMN05892877_110114 [Rhizobium subbaraonis]
MYSRTSLIARGAAAVLLAASTVASPVQAAERDKAFFDQVSGSWQGPGEIVAGKYKGTKFTCNLSGDSEVSEGTGIKLDGHCRVGVFKQPMSALITRAGGTYKGKFLDGAAGKGLDILSGNVTGNKVVVAINRQKLNGAMIARLQDDNTMNITISVKVEDKMVPVIGMSLNRKFHTMAVGSIK